MTSTASWLAWAQRFAALLLIPMLLLLTACDDDDPDDIIGPGNGNGNGGETFSVANYDTTGTEITVSDDDGSGIGYTDEDGNDLTDITWESDFVYNLDNFVYVNDGQTLTIEPGTVIKGLAGSGEDAAALIVARGGQIFADGNPGSDDPADANPIIFTAEADDGNGLGRNVRGEWGGVILLGDATLNSNPGVTQIEGVPSTAGRAEYGGDDDEHNIGVFRFVSIRHTGSTLASGSEIQGLTLGGIGSESTVEYVESYSSNDDGFEFFGGTVNTKYLIAAWAADDAFDVDEGYRGSNQFWLAVQATDVAGRIAEQDGGTDPEGGEPFATLKVANATYIGIGPGVEGTDGDGNNPFLIHRDNNSTSYYNSIFMDSRFTDATLEIEDLAEGEDGRERFLAGTLRYENNLWWNLGAAYDPATTVFEDIIQLTGESDGTLGDGGAAFRDELAQYLRDEDNQLLAASPITSIDRNDSGVIGSFNPLAAGDALATPPAPSVFGDVGGVNADYTTVDFYGAFGTTNWAAGWTLLSQTGELVE